MSFLETLRRLGRREQVTPASLEVKFAQASRTELAPYQEEKRGQKQKEEPEPSYRLSRESIQVLHADAPKPTGEKLQGYLVLLPEADGVQQVIPLENYQQQDDISSGRPMRFDLPPQINLVTGKGKLYVERAGRPAWVFEGIRVPESVPEKLGL